MRTRPTKLLDIPKEEVSRGHAWPSPRTWDFASRQLGAVLGDGGDTTEALPYMMDCVGEGIAQEFMTWLREANLPDPWELLKTPAKFTVPARNDIAFAVLSSVATAATSNLTPESWLAAWEIFGKAAEAGAKDVAAAAVRTLAEKYNKKLPRHPQAVKHFIPLLKMLNWMPGSSAS